MSHRQIVLVKHALPVLDPARPARHWQLGAEGEAQARALAVALRRFNPFRLVTSTEPKAMRTAEIVANEFGVEVTGLEGLREIDRPVLPIMPRDELERFNAQLFEQFDAPVVGAESARAALERFSRALEEVAAAGSASNVVVVTHGTVIALFAAAHNPLDAFHLWQRLDCSMFVVLALPSFQLLEIVNPIS